MIFVIACDQIFWKEEGERCGVIYIVPPAEMPPPQVTTTRYVSTISALTILESAAVTRLLWVRSFVVPEELSPPLNLATATSRPQQRPWAAGNI